MSSPHGPMTVPTDDALYVRGSATLLASWEEYARGSANAFEYKKALPKEGSLVLLRDIAGAGFEPTTFGL
jgi:hypothetical protein